MPDFLFFLKKERNKKKPFHHKHVKGPNWCIKLQQNAPNEVFPGG